MVLTHLMDSAYSRPSCDGGHFTFRWINWGRVMPAPSVNYFHTEKYDHGEDEFCGKSREALKTCIEHSKCYKPTEGRAHHACFNDNECFEARNAFATCKRHMYVADPRQGRHQRTTTVALNGDDLFR